MLGRNPIEKKATKRILGEYHIARGVSSCIEYMVPIDRIIAVKIGKTLASTKPSPAGNGSNQLKLI
jgi:hypothetical protein